MVRYNSFDNLFTWMISALNKAKSLTYTNYILAYETIQIVFVANNYAENIKNIFLDTVYPHRPKLIYNNELWTFIFVPDYFREEYIVTFSDTMCISHLQDVAERPRETRGPKNIFRLCIEVRILAKHARVIL